MFFLGRTIEVEEELFKRKGEGKKKSVEAVVSSSEEFSSLAKD